MDDPQPVIPLEYAHSPETTSTLRPFLRSMILLSYLIVFLGTIAIWFEVRSVLISGPVLFIAGLLTCLGALHPRNTRGMTIGAAHLAVCLTFVILVCAFRWSPEVAYVPFGLMAVAYAVGSFVLSIALLRRHPREHRPVKIAINIAP